MVPAPDPLAAQIDPRAQRRGFGQHAPAGGVTRIRARRRRYRAAAIARRDEPGYSGADDGNGGWLVLGHFITQ